MENGDCDFFLVVLPGWEDLAQRELLDWYPDLGATVSPGGVAVRAPLAKGLALNLCLKIPTRILLRVSEFRCRDFPKLFQRFSAIPWGDWITDPECAIKVVASASRSRLKIKKRIEETCQKAWKKAWQMRTEIPTPKLTSNNEALTLYVRLADDLCTISIDTTGERLHRRGLRQHVSAAPLRENIAASLILLLGTHVSSRDSVEIIDPMMGGGTVLVEALIRDQIVESREFAFSRLVFGSIDRPALAVQRPIIERLIGFESHPKSFEAARHNLQGLPQGVPLEIRGEDFVQSQVRPPREGCQRWVICNPPYGERLAIDGPQGEYYSQLFLDFERLFQPDWVACLVPRNFDWQQVVLPKSWKIIERRKFLNGGIPVWAMVAKTQS